LHAKESGKTLGSTSSAKLTLVRWGLPRRSRRSPIGAIWLVSGV
jgi:hypothetical protein